MTSFRMYARFPMVSLQLGTIVYLLPCWFRRYFQPKRTFTWGGQVYDYFLHSYNTTWRNERCVEIPIAWSIMQKYEPQRVLEVGNVMSHYFRFGHTIVDKYESGRHVIREDVVDYQPDHLYDLIISISTLEHIGWDEHPREPGKHCRAIQHMLNLLNPLGKLVITIPIGYNPELDDDLRSGAIVFDELYCFKRLDPETWGVAEWNEVKDAKFNSLFRGSSAFIVGIKYRS